MTIKTANPSDINQIADLCKQFFTTHNLFQDSVDEIARYLQTESTKHRLIIHKNENQEVTAASFVVKTGESSNREHSRWKFRHFAYSNQEAANQLLTSCEQFIQEQSKTQKIELTIAENENSLEFFESNGYKKEGTLANHYRWGEDCFILAKSIQSIK